MFPKKEFQRIKFFSVKWKKTLHVFFFFLSVHLDICCAVKSRLETLMYEQIKALQLADNVEWPKPQGGAKDPRVAVCACFRVSVWHLWGRAHKPSKKQKTKDWGQRGQEALQNDPRWTGCYSDTTHIHRAGECAKCGTLAKSCMSVWRVYLLHNKDHLNDQIYRVPQFRASGMNVQPNASIE